MAGIGDAAPAIVVLGDDGLAAARRVQGALVGAAIHRLSGRLTGADAVFADLAPTLRLLFAEDIPIVALCTAGVVIRALAPLLADKRAEPPVLAVAEDGSAVVPLLGGGRADDLARTIAQALNAVPAITTPGGDCSDPAATPAIEGAVGAPIAVSPIKPATPGCARGHLAVVGLGPGGGGWMIAEAHKALDAAQDIVGYETYLRMAGPFRSGQTAHASDNREEMGRARHALALAARGRRVAIVSSGDPGVFAMASAVMEALDGSDDPAWHGVELVVIPGISAAHAAAARAGAPLGHDFCILSLSDNLKPWGLIERRLALAAEADLVVALYNPASRARPWQLGRAAEIVRRFRAPATPVVLGRDLGRPGESTRILSLAELSAADADMRTIVIIGSSTTRVLARADGGRWVYTPRRYEGSLPPFSEPASSVPTRSPR